MNVKNIVCILLYFVIIKGQQVLANHRAVSASQNCKYQPPVVYFSAQTTSCNISLFVMPDSYVLHCIYQAANWPMASFYNWLQSYGWISCQSIPNIVN